MTRTIDNRDQSEMERWHTARIEALKARIAELEAENRLLRQRACMDITARLFERNNVEVLPL